MGFRAKLVRILMGQMIWAFGPCYFYNINLGRILMEFGPKFFGNINWPILNGLPAQVFFKILMGFSPKFLRKNVGEIVMGSRPK